MIVPIDEPRRHLPGRPADPDLPDLPGLPGFPARPGVPEWLRRPGAFWPIRHRPATVLLV